MSAEPSKMRQAFSDWWRSLPQDQRYDFDSEGRGYKKPPEVLMWAAWQEAARQAMEQRWVSVRDRMPEDGQSVAFVVDGKGDPHIDYLDGRVLGGVYHASPFGGFGVPGLTVKATHWMPLPPPPASVNGEGEKR